MRACFDLLAVHCSIAHTPLQLNSTVLHSYVYVACLAPHTSGPLLPLLATTMMTRLVRTEERVEEWGEGTREPSAWKASCWGRLREPGTWPARNLHTL